MKSNNNNQVLIALMEKHKFTRQKIADLTCSSIYTVDGWLRSENDPARRTMPNSKMMLLQKQLSEATNG